MIDSKTLLLALPAGIVVFSWIRAARIIVRFNTDLSNAIDALKKLYEEEASGEMIKGSLFSSVRDDDLVIRSADSVAVAEAKRRISLQKEKRLNAVGRSASVAGTGMVVGMVVVWLIGALVGFPKG
jgi:hypothetical protein